MKKIAFILVVALHGCNGGKNDEPHVNIPPIEVKSVEIEKIDGSIIKVITNEDSIKNLVLEINHSKFENAKFNSRYSLRFYSKDSTYLVLTDGENLMVDGISFSLQKSILQYLKR